MDVLRSRSVPKSRKNGDFTSPVIVKPLPVGGTFKKDINGANRLRGWNVDVISAPALNAPQFPVVVFCASRFGYLSLNFSRNGEFLAMWFWGVFFGFLLPGQNLHAALQVHDTNGSTWRQNVVNGPSNATEKEFAISRRIRIYQLKKPPVEEPVEAPPTPEASPTPEVVVQEDLSEPMIQGPDLDPPLEADDKMAVDLEPRVPRPADSPAVRCGEGELVVEVDQNFLGSGHLIHPSDLTLGDCKPIRQADRALFFRSELHACGGKAQITNETLIYTFSLRYSPTPIGDTSVIRTNPSQVEIQCRYPRKRRVSSHAVTPQWREFASGLLTEQQLGFSLDLLTGDDQSRKSSGVYTVGDTIHLEAATLQGYHVPLRVHVDSCVATANAAPDSRPAYKFVDNHGCLVDARLTGAKSYFMQRSSEDKLAFQLRAFNLRKDGGNSVYLTCRLMATTTSVPISSQLKACSFLVEANRWVASGGDNQVCSCCESSCDEHKRKRTLPEATANANATATAMANANATTKGLSEHIEQEGNAELPLKENATASNPTLA
ncbi:zona pellucida sperm-binding protein 3-like [Stigmatopora nigra]